jgi:predicted PurR-regulated permease PerM
MRNTGAVTGGYRGQCFVSFGQGLDVGSCLGVLPAGLYIGLHLIEGETVTPMLLAKRFTLNPVLVIIALVFWFWMWGIPGAILSVPMLAIAKIICDRVRPLAAFGHFLEGKYPVPFRARICTMACGLQV